MQNEVSKSPCGSGILSGYGTEWRVNGKLALVVWEKGRLFDLDTRQLELIDCDFPRKGDRRYGVVASVAFFYPWSKGSVIHYNGEWIDFCKLGRLRIGCLRIIHQFENVVFTVEYGEDSVQVTFEECPKAFTTSKEIER